MHPDRPDLYLFMGSMRPGTKRDKMPLTYAHYVYMYTNITHIITTDTTMDIPHDMMHDDG